MQYPPINKQTLDRFRNTAMADFERDLAETQAETEAKRKEIAGRKLIVENAASWQIKKMEAFRLSAAQDTLADMDALIAFLTSLINAYKAEQNPQTQEVPNVS